MSKLVARALAGAALAAGILAVPAAGAAFAAPIDRGGVTEEYSHQVTATAGDVSYSESEMYSYTSDGWSNGYQEHGHLGYGPYRYYGGGLLGLGLIIL
ncbi:hypothetical protein CFP65_6999 [Kitasatospora sp. MMS16-BH015]|uniref:hypothetical protein n=1 Tax=Kitasatospora sp. MMS16-BH015 TaxID=2018025 RepID=UPI000CA2F56F|nr:hypothetical protein [Kitasatospora sp. MMS16-BH015]AUG81610.1 hypothetical protein CFP65_6999 [Kitasatospora sp. MMS16-BH015]